ncbi:glucose-6-phosphate 1-dehydrogenase [compost metagenome]
MDRIAAAWGEQTEDLKHYPAGSWGPVEASKLLSDNGFKWWPINGQNEGEVDWEAVQKSTVLA